MEEKMNVPFFRPSIGDEEKKAVLDVMDSGWLTTGKVAHEFENEFARYVGSKHALAVNSNTSGMILAMEACGVTRGKAVITTPYTFVSTAASAIHLGADVMFADIEPDSYSISPDSIEEILRADTEHKVAAIVPVHVAGNLCDMKRIRQLADKYSTAENRIRVIEDAAHSFPSKTEAGFAGTLGDVGVFSFYATKTMTTGEGGMVTTGDDSICARMAQMRLHGMSRDAWDRYTNPKASWEYDIIAPGYKSNMPDILAAIGREQLKKAESFRKSRTEIAMRFNEAFAKCDFLTVPPDGEGNSWHLYLIRLNEDKLTITRNEFMEKLRERGLGISMHFIAIHRFTWWKEHFPQYNAETLPNAEKATARTITLPLWPYMDDASVSHVIRSVIETGNAHHA